MRNTLDYATRLTDQQSVERFIEHLSALTVDDWLSVAAAVAHDVSSPSGPETAVDRIVEQQGLCVDAWRVADDVETAFHYGVDSTGVAARRCDRAALRLARQAASVAALAVLARPFLTAKEFESLYRPFARLVPAGEPGSRRCRRLDEPTQRAASVAPLRA